MKKKVLSWMLIVCLVVTLMPLMGAKAEAATFSYDPTVYSSKGIVQNSLSIIFNKYSNGSKFSSSGYKGGYQCYGFAKYCVDTIGHWDGKYGKTRTVLNQSLTQTNIKKLSKWPVGTHLRIGNINATKNGGEENGHSIVLLKVTSSNIYYAEANWKKPNKVTYTASSIKAFDQKYGAYKKIQYVDAPKFYRSSGRASYYTIQYKANGGKGTMSNTKVVYGKSTKTTSNKFTRSGYSFNGWTVRKYVNSRTGWLWYCQKGNTKKWCKTLPSGYSYVKYSNGCSVATTAAAGSTVQFYAQWKKSSSSGASSTNNVIGLVSESDYYSKYSDSSKYTAVPYYRYKTRTMQTTTSTSPSLNGWDLVTTHISTNVGPWTTTKPSGEYETTQAYYYYSYVCNCQRHYWKSTKSDTCTSCKTKMKNLLRVYSKNDPSKYYKKDTDGSYFTPKTISTSSPGNFGTIYRMTYKGTSISKFTSASKKNTSFLWPSSSYRVTLYRTKTSTVSYVYQKLSDWSDWSSWTTSYINDSETSYRDSQIKYYITIKQ